VVKVAGRHKELPGGVLRDVFRARAVKSIDENATGSEGREEGRTETRTETREEVKAGRR
jgi:hypothetical protein